MRGFVHRQDGFRLAVIDSPAGTPGVDGEDPDRPAPGGPSGDSPRRQGLDPLRWEHIDRGRYIARAAWGASLELERRRSEPDAPAGWYLFGELETGGLLGGVYLASRRDEAMVEAETWHRNASASRR